MLLFGDGEYKYGSTTKMNATKRIISGILGPTPLDWLPNLNETVLRGLRTQQDVFHREAAPENIQLYRKRFSYLDTYCLKPEISGNGGVARGSSTSQNATLSTVLY